MLLQLKQSQQGKNGGEVSGNLGDSLNLAAGYVKFQDVMGRDSGKDDGIWHVGAAYNFNNDLTLSGMYLHKNRHQMPERLYNSNQRSSRRRQNFFHRPS